MYTVFFRDIILEQTDPDTGYEIDPNTGLLIDPDNGLLYNPQTGLYYDPATMQLVDPATGEAIDPETGEPLAPPPPVEEPPPPQLDPQTGLVVDPTTGQYHNPQTMEPVDPTTGQPIDPTTGQPTQSAEQMVADQQQQVNNETVKNVEKYIIYSKLLNLKYSLENSSIPNKDPKEFNDIIYHLTILLSFFDTFQYEQIVQIGDFLISRVNSLLNVKESNKK